MSGAKIEPVTFTRRADGRLIIERFPDRILLARDLPMLLDSRIARLTVLLTASNGAARYELEPKDDFTFVGRIIPLTSGVCAACGCSDEAACPGGCSWVDEAHTLCSTCAPNLLPKLPDGCGDCIGGLVDCGMQNDPDQPIYCDCPAGQARQAWEMDDWVDGR